MKTKQLDAKSKVKLVRRALEARGIDTTAKTNVISLTDRLKDFKSNKEEVINKTYLHKSCKTTKQIDYRAILAPTRNGDIGNDVWTVFNVVQEKMIRGGVTHLRKISGIDAQKELNQNLFDIALKIAA